MKFCEIRALFLQYQEYFFLLFFISLFWWWRGYNLRVVNQYRLRVLIPKLKSAYGTQLWSFSASQHIQIARFDRHHIHHIVIFTPIEAFPFLILKTISVISPSVNSLHIFLQ